jgi:hypothetical protein
MIGRRVPCLIEQLHLAQLLDSDTAPICLPTRRLPSTSAIARVLIAKRPQLAFVIAALTDADTNAVRNRGTARESGVC